MVFAQDIKVIPLWGAKKCESEARYVVKVFPWLKISGCEICGGKMLLDPLSLFLSFWAGYANETEM